MVVFFSETPKFLLLFKNIILKKIEKTQLLQAIFPYVLSPQHLFIQ